MKELITLIALAFVATFGTSYAANMQPTEQPVYTIGIKYSGPFAFKQDGKWKGVSVDLLDRLAEKLNFDYELKEVETITALLSLPEYNAADAAIGAISMTDQREKVLDFSHPYFTTTPGILTKEKDSAFWFITKRIAIGMFALLAFLYIVGTIVMYLDPNDDINNPHKGAWFTLVTFTTTGYGDYVPQNAKSKVFAGLLMIFSLFALSGFTGYISSALTVEKLTDGVTTIEDLYHSKVATVAGSTSEQLLDLLNIKHTTVTDPLQGAALVEKDKIQAFVYDKAILDYIANKEDNSLRVWPINRGQERYAIAFPTGSDLREQFNVAILEIIDSPEWKSNIIKYFGEQ